MSITDELRKWAEGSTLSSWTAEHLTAIADRIDAEHERAVRYERCAFWHDASDDELANYGLLRAPIDADGMLWHVGDRDEDGRTVTAIKLCLDGFWIRVGCTYRIAKQVRHYHAPTVEDVLREFAYGLGVPVADSYVAACAAKLRELAESEEEDNDGQ